MPNITPFDAATSFINEFYPDAVMAILFGSAARPDSQPNDLDVFVLLPDGSVAVGDEREFNDPYFTCFATDANRVEKALKITRRLGRGFEQNEMVSWQGWEIDVKCSTPSFLREYFEQFSAEKHKLS